MKNNIKKVMKTVATNLVSIAVATIVFFGELMLTNNYEFYSMFHEFIDFANGTVCCALMLSIVIGVYELTKKMLNTYAIVNTKKSIIVKDIPNEIEAA